MNCQESQMDKFYVYNYLDKPEKDSPMNTSDSIINENKRMKKNYTTKIHVLEKSSKDYAFHLEVPSQNLNSRQRSRILTIPKPGIAQTKRKDMEFAEALNSSREVERRSSHTDLSKLFKGSRKPHPVLTEREIKDIQKNDSNHDEVMSTYIKKMKEGIQRLQEITQKFNCTETYKEDIDYLIRNLKQEQNETREKNKIL